MESGAAQSRKPVLSFIPQGMPSLWLLLFVIWMVANSALSLSVAFTGGIVTFALAFIFATTSEVWKNIRWTPQALYHFIAYAGTFVVELVRSNINMMSYVYAPRIDIKPGIVKVRTRLTSPIGRLALTSSIALTPGSLVIDLRGDTLFIHWLDVKTTDVDEATKALVAPFEAHLEKVFG
ncbi:MAG TPA: Na+/H+ antiporter subunit E [Afipia sp.]